VTDTTTRERAVAYVVANTTGISDRIIDGLDAEFATAEAIAHASANDLQAVDGIGPTLGRRIARRATKVWRRPRLCDLYDNDLSHPRQRLRR